MPIGEVRPKDLPSATPDGDEFLMFDSSTSGTKKVTLRGGVAGVLADPGAAIQLGPVDQTQDLTIDCNNLLIRVANTAGFSCVGDTFEINTSIDVVEPTSENNPATKAYADRVKAFTWPSTADLLVTGLTPLAIGFFYGFNGQIFKAASRAAVGRGVAGNALLQIRVVGGALVSGFSWSSNSLFGDSALAGDVTLAATGWYQIEIVSDNASGTARAFGLDLR